MADVLLESIKSRRAGRIAVLSAILLHCPLLSAAEPLKFYIRQYKVEGSKLLSGAEVGRVVYGYLGPGRTPEDVESARAALEKAYHEKGYQTVSVRVPDQDPGRGVIRLSVEEGRVGRLRVDGARWYLPSRVKAEVPSLAEGSVPDFKRVEKEIVAVNRLAGRRVTPELKAGREAGTVDIDLKVEDEFPLQGSLELNNRYSADTSPLRVNASLSYANLFQLGHTLGTSLQLAPENLDDALVYSGYYLARVSGKMSLMLSATRQDSDISTLGGAAVAGKGTILGLHALVDLPGTASFYQNLDLGLDYKNFEEDLVVGKDTVSSPIEYWPLSATHSATWLSDKHFTELSTSLNFHLRGLGSRERDYTNKRYNAGGDYIFLRGDAAHTRDLRGGLQGYGKVQGQIANRPLVNGEQIAGGGLGTVRGYLEATALGDHGVFGTLELRSPTLIGKGDTSPDPGNEWRFHVFADAGLTGIHDALPGQKKRSGLSSIGAGTRLRFLDHYHASADLGIPLIEQANAEDGSIRITFRGWADF